MFFQFLTTLTYRDATMQYLNSPSFNGYLPLSGALVRNGVSYTAVVFDFRAHEWVLESYNSAGDTVRRLALQCIGDEQFPLVWYSILLLEYEHCKRFYKVYSRKVGRAAFQKYMLAFSEALMDHKTYAMS